MSIKRKAAMSPQTKTTSEKKPRLETEIPSSLEEFCNELDSESVPWEKRMVFAKTFWANEIPDVEDSNTAKVFQIQNTSQIWRFYDELLSEGNKNSLKLAELLLRSANLLHESSMREAFKRLEDFPHRMETLANLREELRAIATILLEIVHSFWNGKDIHKRIRKFLKAINSYLGDTPIEFPGKTSEDEEDQREAAISLISEHEFKMVLDAPKLRNFVVPALMEQLGKLVEKNNELSVYILGKKLDLTDVPEVESEWEKISGSKMRKFLDLVLSLPVEKLKTEERNTLFVSLSAVFWSAKLQSWSDLLAKLLSRIQYEGKGSSVWLQKTGPLVALCAEEKAWEVWKSLLITSMRFKETTEEIFAGIGDYLQEDEELNEKIEFLGKVLCFLKNQSRRSKETVHDIGKALCKLWKENSAERACILGKISDAAHIGFKVKSSFIRAVAEWMMGEVEWAGLASEETAILLAFVRHHSSEDEELIAKAICLSAGKGCADFLSHFVRNRDEGFVGVLLKEVDSNFGVGTRAEVRAMLLEWISSASDVAKEGKVEGIVDGAMDFVIQIPSFNNAEDIRGILRLWTAVLKLKLDNEKLSVSGKFLVPIALTWVSSKALDGEWTAELIQFLNDCLIHQPQASLLSAPLFIAAFRNIILALPPNPLRCAHLILRLSTYMNRFQRELQKLIPYLVSDIILIIQERNFLLEVRTVLTSALHALFRMCGEHSLEFLGPALTPGGNHLLKSTLDTYRKYHKFKGTA